MNADFPPFLRRWLPGQVPLVLIGLLLGGLFFSSSGAQVPSTPAKTVPFPRATLRDEGSKDFFERSSIPTLTIQLSSDNLASLAQNPRAYVRATVKTGTETYSDVAIHLKGSKLGSFRTVDDKPSLTLNFDKFVDGQFFHGMDKIHLNNSAEDPTYLNEYLSGQIFREAGVPAARVGYARVVLDGRDCGLYVLKEGFDKTFLAHWFQNPNGNFYEPPAREDVTGVLEKKSGSQPKDSAEVKRLASLGTETANGERWQFLNELLDIEEFTSFLAAEVLTWHWDGYALNKNNYRIYFDPTPGRFVFLPHGMDVMFDRPDGPVWPVWEGLVAQAFVATTEGKKLYLARLRTLLSALSKPNLIDQRISVLERRIRPAIREKKEHRQAVLELRKRIKDRLRFLAENLKSE